MTGDDDRSHPSAIVYIDRSEIRQGKADELRAGVRNLVDFVEAHEPRLIAYAFHVDEEAGEMTVVAVHPDPASLELHIEVAGGEFRKLAHLVRLQEVRIYGHPSDRALALLQQKAEMLGGGATILVDEPYAGFARHAV
jgi:quinol monooxygenase YgiN